MAKSLPINPNATHEARDLLAYLYSVSGRATLSGQHNQMHHMSEPSEKIQALTGRYPLVWGGEWGFSDARHDTDNIRYRPLLLDQIREQHKAGRIIVLTYHQASPTVGEPCDFSNGVQAKISDQNWDEILTEGTELHRIWAEHVDRLADAFATLQKEEIPIIFRPYHEMNGAWFWWGGSPERFKALWNMLYDRFVNRFKLNGLLWAWTPDKPYPGVEAYFPGPDRVDVLGADIYPVREAADPYPQEWYDRMRALAGGRPLGLSEMSLLPSPEKLEEQPWTWFMCWDRLVFQANTEDTIRECFANPRVWSER